MTQLQLRPYLKRLKIARFTWINSDPCNETATNHAWQNYQIALNNYHAVKGV